MCSEGAVSAQDDEAGGLKFTDDNVKHTGLAAWRKEGEEETAGEGEKFFCIVPLGASLGI